MNALPKQSVIQGDEIFKQISLAKPVVLVTGADSDTRRMLKFGLEMCNYEVAEARGFEESMIIVKKKRPCLILIDAILPFVENLRALDRMQNTVEARDIPIVLLSGFSQKNFQRDAFEHGAKGFLVKPVEWDKLEQCIDKVLQKGGNERRVFRGGQ